MSQQINLFNPIFLKKKKYFSALTMAQGLGLIMLGSVVVVVYAQLQLDDLKTETVSTATQLKQTRAQMAKVAADYPPRQKSKALEDEILRVEAEVKQQKQAAEIVQQGGVGNTKGYSEYLRAFARQVVDGLWLTGFSISGSGGNLELRGRSMQPQLVPGYINRLRQEPIMRGKAFDTLTMELPETVSDTGAAGKQRVQTGYIEFILRSTDEGKSDSVTGATAGGGATANPAGAKAK